MPGDDEFRELLAACFEMAKQTGKQDWTRMTTPVLKNRLLQRTERRFGVSTYGASNLLELLARCGDLVSIDRTTKPTTVEWLQGGHPDAIVPKERVRPNLWHAILDYSSGREYEWDPATGQARPTETADPARKLPTVTRETFGQWRSEFGDAHRAELTTEAEQKRLDEWVAAGLSTQFLPPALRGAWNSFLKERVAVRVKEYSTRGRWSCRPSSCPSRASAPRRLGHFASCCMSASRR